MWEFTGGDDPPRWAAVESPVAATYHDAAVTAQGPCAVGTGGRVVARAPSGRWGVIVEDGPSARGETLYAVAATDDGERLWFSGANGALGCYEVERGRRIDRSEPAGVTDALGGLAVAGPRGAEKLLVADGSGHVYPAAVSGTSLDWEGPTQPAGDTAVTDLDATSEGVGYAVDSNANVFRTTATEGWRRVGVDDAGNSLYAVAATADRTFVGGGNGRVFGARTDASAWTPYSLGSGTVRTLASDGETVLAGGTSGALYSLGEGGWRRNRWAGSKTINGVVAGEVPVAVGAGSLILERADGEK